MKEIAFIGTGTIGNPMAKCLLRANFKVTVCDIRAEAVENLIALGAKKAKHLSECALGDAVIIMVASDEQVEDVISGPEGILEKLPAGKHPIIIIMSTVSPVTVKSMGEKCRAKGLLIADAPVSGGHIAAECGDLSIMVGCEKNVYETIKPLLSVMGKNLYHVGELGSGAIAKVCNNIIGLTGIFLTMDVLETAVRNGIKIETILSVIETSTGSNFATRNWDFTKQFCSHYSKDLPTAQGCLYLCVKDVEHFKEVAELSKHTSALVNHVVSAFREIGPEYLMEHWSKLAKD
jgi:3-hydroxyisobutyrate dehydrogenase